MWMAGQGGGDQDVGDIPSETGESLQTFRQKIDFLLLRREHMVFLQSQVLSCRHMFCCSKRVHTHAGSLLFKRVFSQENRAGVKMFFAPWEARFFCIQWQNMLLQLLFDELEDLDERLRTFKADAKSENTSVKVCKFVFMLICLFGCYVRECFGRQYIWIIYIANQNICMIWYIAALSGIIRRIHQ